MRRNLVLLAGGAIVIASAAIFFYRSSGETASTSAVQSEITPNSITPAGKFYFLFLSDVHLSANTRSSNYGDDTGTDLWNTFQVKIDSILNSPNPPAFILYTGDMPKHGGQYDTTQRNINLDSVLTDLHRMSATKNIPLFYLPGNNDGLGGDYCLFTDENGRTPFSLLKGYSPYPYKEFNIAETSGGSGAYMISASNLASGYYSAMIRKGLRIISLNSVIWSSQVCDQCYENCQLQPGAGDAQIAWLQQQLANAADSGDKVYVAMHVPPGADAYASRNDPSNPVMMWQQPAWQNQFLKAISQYKQTVAGIFYGHTHMDEFRLLYGDSAGNAVSQVAISCPGISPRSGNNPGFKLVTVDGVSKFPTDFTTYYASVGPVVWGQPYSFSTLSKAKPGVPIYETLMQMKPAERNKLLNYTYKVRHGSSGFDTLGLYVKWIN